MKPALVSELLLASLSALLAAQTPAPGIPAAQQRSSGSYAISGIVLGASTGIPLDRAEVTLSTAGQQRTQLATVVTSETGAFRFTRLAAGKYTLDAARRGYITAGYQEHQGFVTAIVAGPDMETQNLRLKLEPEGVLGGIVTDDAGDPVGGAQVSLYRQVQVNGINRIITANSEVSDDTGTYEFSHLRPGEFYLSVTATPWYAFHPPLKRDATGNLLPQDKQTHSALDVAYPTTFYPNATDSGSAEPIAVEAGGHVQANFSLHAVPAVHVRIQIPARVPGRSFAVPQLQTEAFGAEHFQPSPSFQTQTSMDGQSGIMTVDIGGVAPGHYDLSVFGPQGELRGGSIDLTMDQTVGFNSAAGGADVSGRLAMASGQKLPVGLNAILAPLGNQGREIETRVSADGNFDFPSITPGSYEFQAHAMNGLLAVAQMAASGTQVQGTQITVAGDPVLLAATLVAGSVTVNGYAKEGGKGMGGLMILLVPRQPGASHELYRRDQSDSDGSFALNRVVPGDYTVVAIENGWSLDWGRPEVLAPYLAHGLNIHVPDQENSLNLAEPVSVQLR